MRGNYVRPRWNEETGIASLRPSYAKAAAVVLVLAMMMIGVVDAAATGEPQAPQVPDAGQKDGDEAPAVNTLRWTTASEVENFGFEIYRASAEDGPFDRITDEPIPGAGTTDEPTSYEYVDAEIDPTRGYYYYIESISLSGVRERFSPIQHAPPKRAGDPASDTDSTGAGTGESPEQDPEGTAESAGS
jgi:hypothetical protein